MGAQRHDHVHIGPDAFDETANFVQIAGHVEHAIHRPKDIDARARTFRAGGFMRHPAFGHAKFGEDPGHRPVGAFPLIFINRARQEALNIGAHRGDAAADHLGNRSCHHHRRQSRVERFPRPAHCAFGTVTAQFLFAQARHHNRQLMGRQSVGIVQHRCYRQILTPNRAIDHHLQALDGTERINRAPIAPCPIMILHQHQIISSALAARAILSSFFWCIARNSGCRFGAPSQMPAVSP